MLIIISVGLTASTAILLVCLLLYVNTDMVTREIIRLTLKWLIVVQVLAFILGLIFIFNDLIFLLQNNIL